MYAFNFQSNTNAELNLTSFNEITTLAQLIQVIDRYFYKNNVVYFQLGADVKLYNIDLFSLKPPFINGLRRRNMEASGDDGLLTDNIIDAYLYTLSKRYRYFSYANSYISQTLLSDRPVTERENDVIDHAIVTSETTHYTVTINVGRHWMLAVLRLDLNNYSILNSSRSSSVVVGGGQHRWIEERIERFAQIVVQSKKKLEIRRQRGEQVVAAAETEQQEQTEQYPTEMKNVFRITGRQWDGYNCGVFVCWFARQFALNNALNDRNFSPDNFRLEIFKTISSNADDNRATRK